METGWVKGIHTVGGRPGRPRTPMTAFSSAMVTCLARSTAWTTCCWCCRTNTMFIKISQFISKAGRNTCAKKPSLAQSHTCLPPVRGREWLGHRWCLVSWQSQSDGGRDLIVNNIITFIWKRQLFSNSNKVRQANPTTYWPTHLCNPPKVYDKHIQPLPWPLHTHLVYAIFSIRHHKKIFQSS